MKAELQMHLELTTDQVVARLHGNWNADVAVRPHPHGWALHLSDLLSDGLASSSRALPAEPHDRPSPSRPEAAPPLLGTTRAGEVRPAAADTKGTVRCPRPDRSPHPTPVESTTSRRRAPLLDPESREWLRGLRSRGGDRDEAIARLRPAAPRRPSFECSRAGCRGCRTCAATTSMTSRTRLRTTRSSRCWREWTASAAPAVSRPGRRSSAAGGGREAAPPRLAGPRGSAGTRTWSLFAGAGREPDESAEQGELLESLQRAIADVLTPHQRQVLVALALNGVPIDVLAERLGSTRGALYKTLHDARRKLRRHLDELGLSLETLEEN